MGNPLMVTDLERQLELERRLQSIWEQGVAEDARVEAVFGPLESWVFQLEDHRLLLHPVLKQWLYYDAPHDAWQPSGIVPGQGMIAVQGQRFGLRRPPAGVPTAGAGAVTETNSPGALRCPACGMRFKPSQRFCGYCGKALSGEASHG